MRVSQRFVSWLVGPVILVAVIHSVDAGEPRAAFVLKAGWVEVSLKHDGAPLPNASIQIIDETGRNFADGETGPNGQAAFPLPRGSSCMVEIKVAGKSADPIRLHKIDGGVEPARVLLSYGLRPCCRFKSGSEVLTLEPPNPPPLPVEAVPEDARSEWLWITAVLVGLAAVTVSVLAIRRAFRFGLED